MRHLRLLPVLAVPVALLASCGSDAKTNSSTPSSTTIAGASTPVASTIDATQTTIGTATTIAGSSPVDPSASSTSAVATPSPTPGKPTVKIPAALPTDLVITDLSEGTGDPAKSGDTVTVNYVGVRSADGTEFDNSYDRGQPFPVTLGAGSVIAGWDKGLIGVKTGGRRQLDIPASMAYGDHPQGSIIKAGDALSFVIDVVSISPGVEVPTAKAADKPVVAVTASVGATATAFTDLVVGTGTEAVTGSTAYLQIIAYRGDTAAEIQSTWETGTAVKIPLSSQTLPGLVTGVTGMKVGGRREITIIPADAFGAEGSDAMGLPANTDLILVVDLVQVAPAP